MKIKAFGVLIFAFNVRLVVKFLVARRKFPSLAVPITIDDKYLWRKIFDHNPLFVTLSDKLLTKKYLAEHHPAVGFAKVLWRGIDIMTAPQDLLRSAGFLKANHASGFNIRLGSSPPDMQQLQRQTRKWLQTRWEKYHGEWGYAGVHPQLFIEEDLNAGATATLTDFTVYVFGQEISHFVAMHGHKSESILVARFDGRGKRMTRPRVGESNILPPDGTGRTVTCSVLPADYVLPAGTDAMLETARRIAAGHDHLRVDFLSNGNGFFLTEITLYPMGGYIIYEDEDLPRLMTSCWDLRGSWFLNTRQTGWRGRYARWLQRQLEPHAVT